MRPWVMALAVAGSFSASAMASASVFWMSLGVPAGANTASQ